MSEAGANAVRPRLVVRPAIEALQWYAEVLGADVGPVFEHDGTVVFAQLGVLGTTVTLKDAGDAEVHAVHDRPWGGRWGRVRDPFSVQWLLATPDDATPEQVIAAVSGDA